MCVTTLNPIISLDFSQTTDDFNWTNNSANPIETVNGKLVLQPESQLSTFSRPLGNITQTNNRLRFKLNLEIYRPTAGGNATGYYLVQILKGLEIIGQSTVYLEGIDASQAVKYSLDRTYSYEELSGNITIRIKATTGWQNEIRLEKLDVWDYEFCEEDVRTYFVFDGLFEDSQTAQSAGLRLLSWKVDEVETLTNAFDTQNQASVGGNPVAGWKYAVADIDGANRAAAATGRNTFNPFADEFGLIFENIAGNFWGGKPTGTVGAQDFGTGILKLGLEKPVILNGNLQPKAGAFFIDIDYTKNLYIEVDVLVNQSSSNVYNSPTSYRKYFIKWDATTCKKEFYFTNQLVPGLPNDQTPNGFLTGVTGITVDDTVLPCGQTLNYTGNQGSYSFNIELGTTIGMVKVDYNAQNVPDKFDVTWDTLFITSNYRGLSYNNTANYDQQLINAGVPPSQIQTAVPSNGAGSLYFFKTSEFPTTATVTVTAPLGGTAWNLKSNCPFPYMEGLIYQAACGVNLSGVTPVTKYTPAENPITYVPENGGIIYNNTAMTVPFNGGGLVYRMRIPMGTDGSVTDVNYSFEISAAGVISNVQPC